MATAQRGMGPVFILDEDTQRTSGRDAQESNITAGKAVAEAVRTTLGPRGMDKMLVDTSENVVITNDGVTILDEMDIEHPAAQMLVEVAETQEDEVGDGTTTAAVLAGQLLAQAEDLLEQDVHPTTVVEGYNEAMRLAVETIEDLADEDPDDELLTQAAESSMTGKGTGDVSAERLAGLVVEAIRRVEGDDRVRRENVHTETQTGASASATELVEGVIADEGPVRDDMPRQVEDANIAILNGDLEKRETETDVEYDIDSVDQLNAALEAEAEEYHEYANALSAAGVDVLFATDKIADRAAAALSKVGITAFEQVSNNDSRAIVDATGATRVVDVSDIEADDIGHADEVRVESFEDDELVFVEGGDVAEEVTLFVRGGTEHVVEELERALEDATDVVAAAIERGGVVPGAGMTEIRIAGAIRDGAAGIEGRKQLAVEAFADAVDVLPRTLAANAGMDPIDALVDLRSENESGAAGVIAVGETGEIADPYEQGVFDPAAVKREAVESATEAARMIVRIDDIIAAE